MDPQLVSLLFLWIWASICTANVLEDLLRQNYQYPRVRSAAKADLAGLCRADERRPRSLRLSVPFPSLLDSNINSNTTTEVVMNVLGLSLQSAAAEDPLRAHLFIASERGDALSIDTDGVTSFLSAFRPSVSLFLGHQQLAHTEDCTVYSPERREHTVGVFLSCSLSLPVAAQQRTLTEALHTHAELVNEDYSELQLLITEKRANLRAWLSLCARRASNALSRRFLSPSPSPSASALSPSTRFYHTLIGCSGLLSRVDRLERRWPGALSQWAAHHTLLMGLGFIAVYDTDGSAGPFLEPFISLGLVKYFPRFVEPETTNYHESGRDDDSGDCVFESEYSSSPSQFIVDNHCLWQSKGRTEWTLFLRGPSFFLQDRVLGAENLVRALDALPASVSRLPVEIATHSLRILSSSAHRERDVHKKETIFEAFPFAALSPHVRRESAVVDPHAFLMSSQPVRHREGKEETMGNDVFFLREYKEICRNATRQHTALDSDVYMADDLPQLIHGFHSLAEELLQIFSSSLSAEEERERELHHALRNLSMSSLPYARAQEERNGRGPERIMFVAPGLLPVPPVGWGAVENIVWRYATELRERHDIAVEIVNSSDADEIVRAVHAFRPHTLHINIELWAWLAEELLPFTDCVLLTIQSPKLPFPDQWNDETLSLINDFVVASRVNPQLFFVVLSEDQKETLISLLCVPRDRVFVLRNGVETEQYRFSEQPVYTEKAISVGVISTRKGQWRLQRMLGEEEIDFVGALTSRDFSNSLPHAYTDKETNNHPDTSFNASLKNYLGSWSKEEMYARLTDYAVLVHIAAAESAAPLVVLEALAAGLPVVVTRNASANLDLSQPFISVIPDKYIADAEYIRAEIQRMKTIGANNRRDIRAYAEREFSYSQAIVPQYLRLVRELSSAEFQRTHEQQYLLWAMKYELFRKLGETSAQGKQMDSLFGRENDERDRDSVDRAVPYTLAVVFLDAQTSPAMVDWITTQRTLGVDYFVFFAREEHFAAMKRRLAACEHEYCEVQSLSQFPFFDENNNRSDCTPGNELRSILVAQVINEVLSLARVVGVRWLTVLHEHDYFIERESQSRVRRNALRFALRKEEERDTDIVVVHGQLLSKILKDKSFEEDSAFFTEFLSRSIVRVGRVTFSTPLKIVCTNRRRCDAQFYRSSSDGDEDPVDAPIELLSVDLDYLFELRDAAGEPLTESAIKEECVSVFSNLLVFSPALSALQKMSVASVRVQESKREDVCASSPVLFVSLFRDIGRAQWSTQFSRTNDKYVEYFLAMARTITYPLVLYCDAHTRSLINASISLKGEDPAVVLEKIIFRELSSVHTHFDRNVARDRDIVRSEAYLRKVPRSRWDKPEHSSGEYTAIMNSKIDFVTAAREEFPTCSFYAYIDFGYARREGVVPAKMDELKLVPNKISLSAMAILDLHHVLSREELLAVEIPFIQGFSYIVPNGLVETYQSLWHRELEAYYSEGVVDDDQSVSYRIVADRPDLFVLYRSPRWFSLYENYLNT